MVVAPSKVAALCLLFILSGKEQQSSEAFVSPSSFTLGGTNRELSVQQRVSATSGLETAVKSEDLSIPYDAAARLAFEEWKQKYGKKDSDFDDERFKIFKANYEAVTVANVIAARDARELSIAKGEGPAVISISRMELNEFADLTSEEFEALQNQETEVKGDYGEAGSKKSAPVDTVNIEANVEPNAIAQKSDQKLEEVAQVMEAVEATKKLLEGLEGFKFPEFNVELPSLLNADAVAEEEKRIEALMKEREEQKLKREKEIAEAFAASEKERAARQEAQRKEAEKLKEEMEKAAITAAKLEAEREAQQIAKRRAFQEEANKIIREKARTEAENLQRVLEGRKRVVSEELKKDIENVKPSVEQPKVELKSELEPVSKAQEQKVTAVTKESKKVFPNILSSIFSAPPEQKISSKSAVNAISQPLAKSEPSPPKAKPEPIIKPAASEKKERKAEIPSFMSLFSSPVEKRTPSSAQKPSSVPKIITTDKVEASKNERPTLNLADFFPPKEPVKETIQSPVKKPPVTSQIDKVSMDDPVTDALKSLFGGKAEKEKKPELKPVSSELPKVSEKKSSFQLFGSTPKAPAAVKIEATPEPSKKTSTSPFFFGKSTAQKVEPAPAAEPVVVTKKDPFSFFKAPKPAPKIESSSSVSQKLPASKKAEAVSPSLKKAAVASSGTKKLVAARNVEKTAAPKPKQEPFSFFGGSGSEQAPPKSDKKQPVGLSFGTIRIMSSQNKSADEAAKENIPTISNFVQNSDGTVTGKVSGSSKFRSGETITTSPVKRGAKSGEIITTASGSKYRLK